MVLINEAALRPHDEVMEGIGKIHRVMQASIDRGMKAKGTLPGGLNIERRAHEIYCRLEQKFRDNDYDPLLMIDWINLWGFAVAEEKRRRRSGRYRADHGFRRNYPCRNALF